MLAGCVPLTRPLAVVYSEIPTFQLTGVPACSASDRAARPGLVKYAIARGGDDVPGSSELWVKEHVGSAVGAPVQVQPELRSRHAETTFGGKGFWMDTAATPFAPATAEVLEEL